MRPADWRWWWHVGTDSIVVVILAILWISFGTRKALDNQLQDDLPDIKCHCSCGSFEGIPLEGMPIGLGTWQETLGLTQVVFLAVYGVHDAWGGWVRTFICNTWVVCDNVGSL